MTIRVVLGDDNVLVREGVRALLSITEAIRQAGDDPQKIRDALETQTGLQTLTGVVNRGAEEHNGLVPDWLTVRTPAGAV